MTKPTFEPTVEKQLAARGYQVRQLMRRPPVSRPVAVLHIKVFSDHPDYVTSLVTAGVDKFIFAIAKDMDEMKLKRMEAFVSNVSSSGLIRVDAVNKTQGLTLGIARIDAGEKNSKTAADDPDIIGDTIVNIWGDEIAINVVSAGASARGLGVILEFG